MLMDGELCGDDAEILLDKLKHNPEAQQEWLTYHLIGDSLRQPDFMPFEMSDTFSERLHAEPTVLAPRSKPGSKTGFFAMSAAASIMAMVFLAWLTVQIDAKPVLRQAVQSPNAVSTASSQMIANIPVNDSMNDYLLAHQELSPGNDVRGAASYIRTVAARQPIAGQ